MKLTVNGAEIEIKVKDLTLNGKDKYNKEATVSFLNTMSILAQEASTQFAMSGCNSLAEEARKIGKDIYNFLDSKGVYKKL